MVSPHSNFQLSEEMVTLLSSHSGAPRGRGCVSPQSPSWVSPHLSPRTRLWPHGCSREGVMVLHLLKNCFHPVWVGGKQDRELKSWQEVERPSESHRVHVSVVRADGGRVQAIPSFLVLPQAQPAAFTGLSLASGAGRSVDGSPTPSPIPSPRGKLLCPGGQKVHLCT